MLVLHLLHLRKICHCLSKLQTYRFTHTDKTKLCMLKTKLEKLKLWNSKWSWTRVTVIFASDNAWYKLATQPWSVSSGSLWINLLGHPPAGCGQCPMSRQITLGQSRKEYRRMGLSFILWPVRPGLHLLHTFKENSAHLEGQAIHRKNNTSEGNQRVTVGGRLRERPSSHTSMKAGTEMQTVVKLKSPQNPLLLNDSICFNHKHWIGLHVTLSALISSPPLSPHLKEMADKGWPYRQAMFNLIFPSSPF